MVRTITPFSTRAKEGATDSPLGDFVSVDQEIISTADVGFYDSNTGKLTGVQASDKVFGLIQKDEGVANGGTILTPSVNPDGTWPLDMTGFNDLIFAIKTDDAGNYETTAVMGPDSNSFGGLSPVNSAATLRGTINDAGSPALSNILVDGADSLTANVWNIFYIGDRCRGQKLLQFKIVNNSGGAATIETAFMRLV